MLTTKENERLTQVGSGTPLGELMRRYWHPIAALAQLDKEPTKAVKILGEDLVLYKDRRGTLGLVGQACAHRRVNLLYGIPEEQGLRCPYHGWLYNEKGQCLEQPAEAPDSTFKDRIKIPAYPVQALGGLVFAYLGPEPAPLLPRWDLLVWDNVARDIGIQVVPCNWLQIMENSLDPVHVEWLHGYFPRYILERMGRADFTGMYWAVQSDVRGDRLTSVAAGKHQKIGFDLFDHGIVKRRVVEGTDENHPAWRIGHPILFPNILRVGTSFEFRVPADDTHTLHVWYTVYSPPEGVELPKQETVPYYDVPLPQEKEGHPVWPSLDFTIAQDMTVWMTQGPVADRSQEKVGESDKGIILFRRLLREQLDNLEAGRELMNVFQDGAKAEYVELPWEGMERGGPHHGVIPLRGGTASKWSPVLREMVAAAHGDEAISLTTPEA
jgi:5,5'-dehydrodivanillate O-demethylase